MELLLLNGSDYSQLIEQKQQENKRPQSLLEFNSDYLENTSRFFEVLKAVASSTDGDQIIIIKRKKQNKSTPSFGKTELTKPAKAASDPAKNANQKAVQKEGCVKFQCRRNKRIFVEHFLREANKELGLFITPISEVIDIFFSKKIVPRSKKIYLECGNPRFVYILKKLEICFISLNFRNIGRSELFYNEYNTKITESALYTAWHRTRYDPADVAVIDAIFKKVEQICTDILHDLTI